MIAPSGNALHFAKLSPEATLIIEYEKAGHKIVWIQVQFPSTRSHRRSIEDCVVLNPVEVKFTDSSYMLIFERKKTEPNKAVETTPVAVTPGADAPVAPSTSVSHLRR
jgi:hypothetical protein